MFFRVLVARSILLITLILTASKLESACSFSFHNPALSSSTSRPSHRILPKMSLNDEMLDKVLEVAIDASKKAGEIIIGNAGGAEVTEKKANSRDLLTLIDPLCEKVSFVTKLLTKTFLVRTLIACESLSADNSRDRTGSLS
jgi:hypothetical protein